MNEVLERTHVLIHSTDSKAAAIASLSLQCFEIAMGLQDLAVAHRQLADGLDRYIENQRSIAVYGVAPQPQEKTRCQT